MRKLLKRELMSLSRVLKAIDFRTYVEDITTFKMKDILKSEEFSQNEKSLMIFGNVIAYVIENVHMAENEIDELISSYKDISSDEIEELDVDGYIEILKEVLWSGVPKVVEKYLDLTNVKKNMEEQTQKT
jgi:hypothetical protein